MLTFITVIHILFALFLIFFVLLQDSKGGAMGMLGGGSTGNNVFGATGAVNILVKLTRWTAIAFALTCIGLTVVITGQTESSLLDNAPAAATSPVQGMAPAMDAKDDAPKAEPEKAEPASK